MMAEQIRPRRASRHRRRPLQTIGIPLIVLVILGVTIGIPLVMTGLWSGVDPKNPWTYPNPVPPSLSLYQWDYVFRYTDIVPAAVTSYVLASVATTLAFLLALPAAYAIARYDFRGKSAVRILMLLPLVLPGMVVALFLSRAFYYVGLAQTFQGLVLGHTLLGLPFMSRLLTTSFEAIPREVSDAASNMGASEVRKLREIYLPMAASGIFAAAIFTFVTSLEEFALTFVIGTPDFQTIPTILFSFLGQRFNRPVGAALSLVLLIPNLVLLFVAERMVKEDIMTSGYGKL
jgi:putative spermidine/putrescine transport system permease protein